MVAGEIGTKRTASVRLQLRTGNTSEKKDAVRPVTPLRGYFFAGTIIASTSSAM